MYGIYIHDKNVAPLIRGKNLHVNVAREKLNGTLFTGTFWVVRCEKRASPSQSFGVVKTELSISLTPWPLYHQVLVAKARLVCYDVTCMDKGEIISF